MGYITKQGLLNLKAYKYVSGGSSLMDNIMNYWWEFTLNFIPMSMAPNLITLVGLVINLLGAIQFLFYDSTLTKKMPPCMIYIGALCGFVYQTMDAIDGK